MNTKPHTSADFNIAMDLIRDEMAANASDGPIQMIGGILTSLLQRHPELADKLSAEGKGLKKAMDSAMVLNDPTIFGMAGGKFLGGGEAGNEVVSGEAHLLDLINGSVDSAIGARMDSVLDLLREYLPGCAQPKVGIPINSIERALAANTQRRQEAW